MTEPILTIQDLRIDLGTAAGSRQLVAGIDLAVERGQIHGLAGESGSGKTITALAVLGLTPQNMRVSGSIRLARHADSDDEADSDVLELVGASRAVLAGVRGRRVAMIFQDPSTSLHPQLTVGRQLTDHVRHHLRLDRRAARDRAITLLTRVRVPEPAAALKRYPHQFSGGQRQRIAIAIALACDPDVLLADEPTTALDVTVQAGVLRLLRELVDDSDLSVLLVTHDLGVLSAVADLVTVMRSGVVVESAARQRLFTSPRSAYTRTLLAALPGSTQVAAPDAPAEDLLPLAPPGTARTP